MRDVTQLDINKLSVDDILSVIDMASEDLRPSEQMRRTMPFVVKCLPEDIAANLSGVEAIAAFKAFSSQVAKAIGSGTGPDDLGN